MLDWKQPYNIAKIKEIGNGVMYISNGKFIFQLWYLVVESPYDVVSYLFLFISNEILCMITEYDIAFNITCRFSKNR